MATPAQPLENDPQVDFYVLLGVSKTATEKEINTAYKKLAMKYHPDRTRGDLEAAEKFKEIATAYAVLSDPNRRRQYDLSGGDEEAKGADYTPMDMEGIGSMGRVVGALIGKLGVPIQTSIAQSSLSEAYELCQNSGLNERNPRLLPMECGVEYKGTVEKQQSVFFMIHVTKDMARDGLVLRCTSTNKSRFKLVLFDNAGKARYQEESSSTSNNEGFTMCSLFFAPYEVSNVADTINIAGLKGEEVPPIFHRLDLFQVTSRQLEEGDHLVGVYGDNWLRAASFSLMAIPLSPRAKEEESSVVSVDAQLVSQREQLKAFKPEYLEAKAKWEATLGKLEELTAHTTELVRAREVVYDQLVGASLSAYAASDQAAASAARRGVPANGSVGSAVNVNHALKKRRGAAASSSQGGGGGGGAGGGLFGRLF
ncbi:unnamed protein product [Ectocarpus sp. 6 AP-2014]